MGVRWSGAQVEDLLPAREVVVGRERYPEQRCEEIAWEPTSINCHVSRADLHTHSHTHIPLAQDAQSTALVFFPPSSPARPTERVQVQSWLRVCNTMTRIGTMQWICTGNVLCMFCNLHDSSSYSSSSSTSFVFISTNAPCDIPVIHTHYPSRQESELARAETETKKKPPAAVRHLSPPPFPSANLNPKNLKVSCSDALPSHPPMSTNPFFAPRKSVARLDLPNAPLPANRPAMETKSL